MPSPDMRSEERLGVTSVVFPFLGSRALDFACFEYLPMDFSAHGLQIVIPKWVVNRERLLPGESVNLHVPFKVNEETYCQGDIVWARQDEAIDGFRYGIRMTMQSPPTYPLFISLGTEKDLDLSDFATPDRLLVQLFKDAVLLKKGVQIYFDHLVPYFSRISDYPGEQYPELKKRLFDEIGEKIKLNYARLSALYARIQNDTGSQQRITKDLDLEELRGIVESELSADLLQIALGTDAINPYLNAIKELEKKQYTTYNAIVLLYVRSL